MRFARYLFVLPLALLAGCASMESTRYEARWPEPRPLGPVLEQTPISATTERPASTGPLTLHDALYRTLGAHPALVAIRREVAAREAEALQAGLPPNPELEAEVEDILGGQSGEQDLGGVEGAEGTLLLSQTIELAGKRMKRRLLAEAEADVAAWDLEARRLELVTETHAAFVEVLAAQERVELAARLVEVASRAHDTVSRRVEAGKVSPVETRRARVALETQRTDLATASEALEAARRRLAAQWGGEPVFSTVAGNLELMPPAPELAVLNDTLAQNPQLARWATEMAARRAALALAEARAVPDPSIGAGARYYNETDNHAFVVGVSIPLPLFDRNQGNIAAARERLAGPRPEEAAVARSLSAATAGRVRPAFHRVARGGAAAGRRHPRSAVGV
ncbi:TolC family protein [bacterium]|nr:TolC family protein [bacterium]